MNDLSPKDLKACQARGILAGPGESELDFMKRASAQSTTSLEHIKNIFSISPDWVEVTQSNQKLLPWQGGCAWIQGNQLTLQVRKGSGKLWGLYDREEIIGHELVHAARMAFNEPVFEEILAYQTSPSRFRRFYGPLFRTSQESLLCVGLLALFAIVNLLYTIPLITTFLSGTLLSFFFFRLHKNQRLFSSTLTTLTKLLQCKKLALQFILHLTDREIRLFSKKTPDEIREYGRQQKCLRWKQIRFSMSFAF